MTTFTGADLTGLKTEINTSDIWNDVRVMLPSYDYTLELKDDGWHKYPVDLVARSTDGASINKYGRRTKTQSKHVIEQAFAEAYCEGEVAKCKEPVAKVELQLMGSNDANIIATLTTRVARQINYQYTPAGLNDTGSIDNLVLDVDLDGIPRLTLNITQSSEMELTGLFEVDIDAVDGTDVIG